MNVNCQWLQRKLCSEESSSLIILDCRNSFDYDALHIKNAINFSIPTILLRRLQQNKIDLLSTISRRELRERIEKNLENGSFVLYNDFKYTSTSKNDNTNTILNVLFNLLEHKNARIQILDGK